LEKLDLPELPEVESLVRGIRTDLIGRSFSKIEFYRKDLREKIPQKRLRQILLGETIHEVVRRGKYFLIGTNQGFLGVHLGMSGRFVKSDSIQPQLAHTHACFEINSDTQFRYIDPRRFGRLFSIEKNETNDHPFLASLGVEPLDKTIDLAKYLFQKSRTRKQPIKNFLMDSSVVVGIGNIYASEALWLSKIHPEQPANTMSLNDFSKVSDAAREVLNLAIEAGGTTFRDYRDKDGNPGYFQKNLSVYGKVTKPCMRCGGEVLRLTLAGRSTFFCSFCQKLKINH
jgi:formamidopyrimidine-DNA glycosylase